MGFREWANKNPKTFAGVVGGLVVLMMCVVGIEAFSGRPGYPKKGPDSFFSDDDGKTYFVAGADKFAPFDHNGRTAVRAYVFKSNGTKFVGVLERYIPSVKAKLDSGAPLTAEMVARGRDLKHPGDATWTHVTDVATESRIEDIKSPNGSSADMEEVEP